LSALRKLLLIFKKSEDGVARKWAETLKLKFADISDPVNRLSGGNQQKVVLSKWLATEPKVLIVDEPTRGIDVGTKAEVHRLLSQEAQAGMAIIMVSSELPEVLGMSDRVLVMREGLLVKELTAEEATPESVITAATGAGKH
jgi:rhamnose transport system ATP-binding protein